MSDFDSLGVGIEIPSRNVRVDARVMLDGKNGGRAKERRSEESHEEQRDGASNRVTLDFFGESASRTSKNVRDGWPREARQ